MHKHARDISHNVGVLGFHTAYFHYFSSLCWYVCGLCYAYVYVMHISHQKMPSGLNKSEYAIFTFWFGFLNLSLWVTKSASYKNTLNT